MHEIDSQVRQARRRMNLDRFVKFLILFLTAGLVVGCVGFAIPRLWALNWTQGAAALAQWQWGWLLGGLALALCAAILWTWRTAVNSTTAATEIDRRFGLKERVCSALTLSAQDAETPAGRSLLADAEARVAKIDVRDEFKIQMDRRAWLPLVPAAFLAALFFVPAKEPPSAITVTETAADQKAIETVIEETKRRIEEQTKRLAEKGLEKAAEDIRIIAREFDSLKTDSSELKKETLVKFNDIKKQLDEQRSKIIDPEQLKQEFSRLKDLSAGPGKQFAEALKEGDLKEAQKILKDLARKIQNEKLDEADLAKLADNLKELAQSIDQMVKKYEEEKQNLQQQIEQAKQEGNADKVAELENKLDQLEEREKQLKQMERIAEKLKECQHALKADKKAEAGKPKPGDGKNSANKSQKNNAPQDGKANPGGDQQLQDALKSLKDIEEIMDQISKDQEIMEALEDLEKELEECKGQCQGQGKENKGLPKKMNRKDFAKGGGRGEGERGIEEDETGGFKTQVKAKLQKGQTIISGEADGENAETESLIEAQEVVRASMAKDSDPLEDQQLPKSQREHARQYFEKLRKGG